MKIINIKINNYISGILTLTIIIVFFNNSSLFAGNNDINEEVRKKLAHTPFEMKEIRVPDFPNKTFNIKDFGAIGNGEFNNAAAINKAIEECSKNGGGQVIIPAGLWLTGPVKLMNNVDLHLETGAIVSFSRNHDDYEIIKPSGGSYICESPISGYNLTNIAITGDGIFEGSGDTWRPVKKAKMTESQWKDLTKSGGVVDKQNNIWWPSLQAMNAESYLAGQKKNEMTKADFENVKDFLRPNMLQLYNCTNVFLDGFTLRNSPKFHLYANRCKEMVIRNVKVMTDWWAQNGDGLDISACKNVLMYGCTVNAGDDGICMKSSTVKNEQYALENIVITGCVVYHAHGGFVIGSNTDGGMRNVFVKDCSFIGTETGLRFKSNIGRGGKVENIFIENIFMKDIINEAIIFDMTYEDKAVGKGKPSDKEESKIPYFTNFVMKNIYCDGAKKAFLIDGQKEISINNINLSNSVISAQYGLEAKYADSFKFTEVIINAKNGALFSLEECSNFTIKNGGGKTTDGSFIKVTGSTSKNNIIEGTDLSKYKTISEISPETDKNAVIIK